ncbi:hypothetical protein [Williamsia sp.]|uniref:hypothetical protein n=1 Tax=Williamsia sp. TaxID=1872085 RepID=UPI002F92881B
MSVLSAPISFSSAAPVSAPATAPLSISADQFRPALEAGAVAVDIRSQRVRDDEGILLGALAIPARNVLDRLTPGSAQSLSTASVDQHWILVGVDGHDAEMLTWHLQARGITGARFVAGGQRALSRHAAPGLLGEHTRRELTAYAAH